MTVTTIHDTGPDDGAGLLRGPEVCAAAGITYRQLDFWDRCGLLRPAKAANGSGTQRLWDADEVVVIRRMAALVAVGIHPRIAAHAARNGYRTWLSDTVRVEVRDDDHRDRAGDGRGARRGLRGHAARRATARRRRATVRRRTRPRRLRRSTGR